MVNKNRKSNSPKRKAVKSKPKSAKLKAKKIDNKIKITPKTQTKKVHKSTNDKEVILIVAGLIFAFVQLPMLGHIIVKRWRKGLVYNAGLILVWIITILMYLYVLAPTIIGILCFPIFIIPFLMSFLIFYDYYRILKGDDEYLPPVI